MLTQDNFYNYCLSESARRDRVRDADRVSQTPYLAGHHTNVVFQGLHTGLEETDEQQLRDALPRIRRRVKEYGSSFSERAQTIVHGLQSHTDLDCRFLGIRLSFSDFYKTKKDQQQRS